MGGTRVADELVAPIALEDVIGRGARGADCEGGATEAGGWAGYARAGVGEEAGGSAAEAVGRVVGRAGSARLETFRAVICTHYLHIALIARTIVASTSTSHSAGGAIIGALLAHSSNVRIPSDASSCIVDIDRTGRSVGVCATLAGSSDESCRTIAGGADGIIGAGTGETRIEASNDRSCRVDSVSILRDSAVDVG